MQNSKLYMSCKTVNVNMLPGDHKRSPDDYFFINRNVFKHMNLSNGEMFPSDLLRSLDVLFFNKYYFFGGFLYG